MKAPLNKAQLDKDNAFLVHVCSDIPGVELIAGMSDYESPNLERVYGHREMRENHLPISVARRTLHFTLSHVVGSEGRDGAVQRGDRVAILIPLKNLPEDVRKRMWGSPEDVFLPCEKLSLEGLGARLIIPISMVAAYKGSNLKKVLGDGIKASSYNNCTVAEAFQNVCKSASLPYVEHHEYWESGNVKSPVVKYRIEQNGRENLVIKAQDLFANSFKKEQFLFEHALSAYSQIELVLSSLTEAVLLNTSPSQFVASEFRGLVIYGQSACGQHESYDVFKSKAQNLLNSQEYQDSFYCRDGYYPLLRKCLLGLFECDDPEEGKTIVASFYSDVDKLQSVAAMPAQDVPVAEKPKTAMDAPEANPQNPHEEKQRGLSS